VSEHKQLSILNRNSEDTTHVSQQTMNELIALVTPNNFPIFKDNVTIVVLVKIQHNSNNNASSTSDQKRRNNGESGWPGLFLGDYTPAVHGSVAKNHVLTRRGLRSSDLLTAIFLSNVYRATCKAFN
jgi:hypothetical protein